MRQLEKLPEGWGIVFDDVAAGLYALGVASLLRLFDPLRLKMPRTRTQSAREQMTPEPRIDEVAASRSAARTGEVELVGANLGPNPYGPPVVVVGTHPAQVLMSRPGRVAFRVPENAISGLVEVRTPAGVSNGVPLHIARELSSGLHPVTSPAVSRSGMIYATISGQRGKQTPVSVVRVSPDGRGTPFATGISERHRA